MRSSELVTSAEVLQSLLGNGKHPLSDHFLRWKVWAQWEEVVGASISKNCQPVGFYFGTLEIWVRSSAWLQEMRFLTEDIRRLVNQYVGKEWVVTLKFTLDRHQVPDGSSEGADIYRRFVQKNTK